MTANRYSLASMTVAVSACAVIIGFRYHMRGTGYFFSHGSNRLYEQYCMKAGEKRGVLPADTVLCDNHKWGKLAPLFNNSYVVNNNYTNCSFVSIFMLLTQRDSLYACRVLDIDRNGDFAIKFPGMKDVFILTKQEIDSYIEKQKPSKEFMSSIYRGYVPYGLTGLMYGYHRYLVSKGVNSGVRSGSSYRDLLIMTGAPRCFGIVAHDPTRLDRNSQGDNFEHSRERLLRFAHDDTTIWKIYEATVFEAGDPLSTIDIDKFLVVLNSSPVVPRWFGPRIVPAHAYYLIGKTEKGSYIIGNSYQTRRPLEISGKDLLRWFNAIYFVELNNTL